MRGVGVEIGDQQFDAGARAQFVNLPDRLGVQPGAAVGQIVAGDAGDGGVPQAHGLHRLRDPPGFAPIECGGAACVDLAEVAPPGALASADEERRLTVLPAFEDVGTSRFLTHGVQVLAVDEGGEVPVFGARPHLHLHPRRFAFDRGLSVADFEAEQSAAFGR